MHSGFTGSYDQPPPINYDVEIINDIIQRELEKLYEDNMQGMKSSRISILEVRDDRHTLNMLHAGTLPMPINQKQPLEVVYYRACFEADTSKEIELLIGRFRNPPVFCSLGIHDGQEWTRPPVQIVRGMNREI